MADFKTSFATLAQNEAGYTIDNGGETYKGISRKAWPKWAGWQLIDTYKKKFGQIRKGSFITSTSVDEMVLDFYRKNYWQVINGDNIKTQLLADFILDFYANTGGALLLINKGLGARITNSINEDSLKILNERPAFAYQVIYSLRKKNYDKLVLKPKLKKYADGWYARLERFPKELKAGPATFTFNPYSFFAV